VPHEATDVPAWIPGTPDQELDARAFLAVEEEPGMARFSVILVVPHVPLDLNAPVSEPSQHVTISEVENPEPNADHEDERAGA
jgi:hypothetical protein